MAEKTELIEQFRQNYLDHLQTETYNEHEFNDEAASISILEFEDVVPECRLYFSLGLSSYSDKVGIKSELFAASSGEWEVIPSLLASLLITFVSLEMPIVDGQAIGGIENISDEFIQNTGKSSIYFTEPMNVPETLGMLYLPSTQRLLTMGVFITQSEHDFLVENGPDAFEEKMAEMNVSPFDIHRPSAV